MDEPAVVAAFLARIEADRASRTSRTVEDYQGLFPGFEGVIAREFQTLDDGLPAEPPTLPHGADSAGLGRLGSSTQLGRFRILRPLARGGQGEVYLAEDEILKRRVALKVLRGLGPYNEDLLRRFRREAEVASRLDHPGICAVHDSGSEGNLAWIAMRYVDGRSLAEDIAGAVARGRPPERPEVLRATQLVERAAHALHAAHEAGIIHRDVKPSNIMVTPEDEPILLDFGLAADVSNDATALTRSGDRFGTPAYMSPEQVAGDPADLDRRTDVWSLGATLYELLTLQRPFRAATREALYEAIRLEEPADPRRLNPAVPRDLAVVVLTALQKETGRRYATAFDFGDDLRRLREHEPVRALPVSAFGRLVRWARRYPARAALITVLVVSVPLLAALAGYSVATRPDVLELRRRTNHEEIERLLERGFFEVTHGSTAAAEITFEEILGRQPDHPEAVAGLVYGALKQEDPPRALAALERSRALVDRHDELRRVLRNVLRMVRRPEDAATLREQSTEPHTPLGFFFEGLLESGRGHGRNQPDAHARAAVLYDKAVAASSTARALYHFELLHAAGHIRDAALVDRMCAAVAHLWPDSTTALRWTVFALEDLAPARADLAVARLLALDPHDAVAWQSVGHRHHQRGENTAAIEAYRKSVASDPERVSAHDGLGLCLRNEKRFVEAIASHRRAIEIAPNVPAPWLHLGHALRQAGEGDAALESIQKAAALGPDIPEAHCALGLEFRLHGRLEDSEPALRRALELRPGWNLPLIALGASLMGLGRTEESLVLIRPALASVEMSEVSSLRKIAQSLAHQNRLEDLVAIQTRFTEVMPDSAPEWAALGRLHLERRHHPEAAGAYRRAVSLDPADAVAFNNLGCATSRLGKPAEAAAAFRNAVELKNDYAEAWIGLSTELGALGQFREARDAIARADDLGRKRPDWPHATGAALRLCEQALKLAEGLDERLAIDPATLATQELLELAGVAAAKERYAAATRLYETISEREPAAVRTGPGRTVRRAAAAAIGASLETGGAGDARRNELRALALSWLEDEMRTIAAMAEARRMSQSDARAALDLLRHADAFEPVRDEAALAQLSADEQAAWQAFWARLADSRRDLE